MPRKAPTAVNEHRLTLGDWERAQVMPITDEIQQLLKTGRIVTQVGAGVTGAAALTAAIGLGLAGYGAYAWLVSDGALTKAWNAFKESIIDPTGFGKWATDLFTPSTFEGDDTPLTPDEQAKWLDPVGWAKKQMQGD